MWAVHRSFHVKRNQYFGEMPSQEKSITKEWIVIVDGNLLDGGGFTVVNLLSLLDKNFRN